MPGLVCNLLPSKADPSPTPKSAESKELICEEDSRPNKCAAAERADDRQQKKRNKPRTCTHCKSLECKGRWSVNNCPVKAREKGAFLKANYIACSVLAVASSSNVTLD